jgi:hypothetical protein
MWCYACILDILTLNSGAHSHFCELCLRNVIWRGALVGWRASTPLKFLLSHTFRETLRTCRVLFRHCYQLFPEMEVMLIEKVHQRTILYDTKWPDYRDQHLRANAWEEIGKGLKIKRKTWREDSVSPALKLPVMPRSTQCWQSVRRSVGPALLVPAEKEHPVLSLYFLIVYQSCPQLFQIAVVQCNSQSYFVLCTMPIGVKKLSSPSSSLSSTLSPSCRVFIHIFLRQTMSLGNTLLQLFCCYCLWCLYL